jgi:gamma-glutamylcyclotransferase (GGCT)/AIG2-like uncharacterized protein YtfP
MYLIVTESINGMKLFVYGTLRRGFSNHAARRLHARAEYVGTAVVRARLCRNGDYTGLLPGAGRVRGEVFRVTAHLLRYLDAYEGSDYRRTIAPVRLQNGIMRRSFVYMLKARP